MTGKVERQDLLRFVERFAMGLTEVGLPRMPARVFAYVLVDDAERYTAAELASGLRVSPAAISGAVRTLVQAGLLGKEREPGARVDTYRVYDHDIWGVITTQRGKSSEPIEQLAAEGVALLGPDSPGGRRMRETQEFYAFFRRKLPEILDEWHEYRRKLFDAHADADTGSG
ncbi:MAG TPA: MarR family transcriptional regulator [Natronosporangium sp.]|nr:MarR family transcriptional regulator [Natronosporangium sp.]